MPTTSVLWSNDGSKSITKSGVPSTKTETSLDTIEATITLPANTYATKVYWTMYLSDCTGSSGSSVYGAFGTSKSAGGYWDGATEGNSYTQEVTTLAGQTNTYRMVIGVRVKNNYGAGSTNTVKGTAKWTNIYLNADYEYSATACTAPTSVVISTNSVAPGAAATLSWSGAAAGTANAITGYQVYISTSAGGPYSYLNTVSTSNTYGSTNVSAGANGTTYYYKIHTIGSVEGFNSPISANYAYLTATYSNPIVNSFKIGTQSSTVCVGEAGVGALTASWAAVNGTNNPIQSYSIYQSGNASPIWTGTTAYANIIVSGGHSYYVVANGSISNSASSNSISCVTLKLNSFPLYTSPGAGVSSSRTFYLSWGTPTASAGTISTIGYDVYYWYGGTAYYVTSTANNNYTITIPTSVPVGQSFDFQITAICYAGDSGYSVAVARNYSDYKISGAPNAPKINSIYDSNRNPLVTGIQSLGYRNIIIGVDSATQNAANASGNSFIYRLYYSINNGAYSYESLNNTNNSGSFTLNKNLESYGVSPGSTITFYIQATDNYGYSVNSNSVTMRRFQLPSITWGNINSTANGNNRVTNAISGTFNGVIPSYQGSQNINYTVTVAYNGNDGAFETGSYTTTNTNSFSFSITCPQSSDSDNFSRALYAAVITNQNPIPQGQININLYYEGYAAYSITASKNFNFNYIKGLSANPTYTINYPSGRAYFNPFEAYTITCGAVNWTNAAGESNGTGGTLTRTCTRGGASRAIVGNNVSDSFQNYTSSDTIVNYIITHTLTYAGYPSYSSSKSTTVSVNIARWYQDPTTLQDTNLDRSDLSHCLLKGKIVLPQLLCASGKYGNLVANGVSYRIYDTISKTYFPSSGWYSVTNDELNAKTINLNVDFGKYNDVIIYAEIQYTNTANGKINSITNISILHDASTTVALRKGYLGINVSQDHGYTKAPDSVVEINQGTIKNPTIIGLKAGDSTANYISFNNGVQDVGKIVNKPEANSIFFDGLTYQVDMEITTNNYDGTNDGWSSTQDRGWIYKFHCPYVNAKTTQEIYPKALINASSLKAFQKAQFIGYSQSDSGWVFIRAMGIKPTISIPVTLVVRGF